MIDIIQAEFSVTPTSVKHIKQQTSKTGVDRSAASSPTHNTRFEPKNEHRIA